jgi:COP9 signalosome complex subunit 2
MSSDEEYEYDYDDDQESMEEGSVGGSDEEGGVNMKVEIENNYYEGQDKKEKKPEEALGLFNQVVKDENELVANGGNAVWRFKALQQIVILNFRLNNFQLMMDNYKIMLSHMSSVSRDECTRAIDEVLETASGNTNKSTKSNTAEDEAILTELFQITLNSLKGGNSDNNNNNKSNERLWFKTNIKLATLYLKDFNKYINKIEDLLSSLKLSCQIPSPDGSTTTDSNGNVVMNMVDDIATKSSNLLELYCIEIQLCRLINNSTRMRLVYSKTTCLNTDITDPRIMGIIHEEGGIMRMSENDWDYAYDELNSAFRSFQSSGNSDRARTCLKYVALCSMLTKSDDALNPFVAAEAKAFMQDPEIMAMSDLRRHLQNNDLKKFESILNNKSNGIANEVVIMTYLDKLRQRMREHVLVSIVSPYKKVTIKYLANELRLTTIDVESMLVNMIHQKALHGYINQIEGVLELNSGNSNSNSSSNSNNNISTTSTKNKGIHLQQKKSQALGAWADALLNINNNLSMQLT